MAGQHYEALDTVLEWRPFEMAKQIGVSLLPGEKPCDVDGASHALNYCCRWCVRVWRDRAREFL